MPKEEERLELNRSLQRVVTVMGFTPGIGLVIGGITSTCILINSLEIFPSNLIFGLWSITCLTALVVLRDGIGVAIAQWRKPPYYTRGNYRYRSPLDRTQTNGRKKNQRSGKKRKI